MYKTITKLVTEAGYITIKKGGDLFIKGKNGFVGICFNPFETLTDELIKSRTLAAINTMRVND